MAKCDGAINSDDLARGLCIEARYSTCMSRRTAGAGGCIYKAMANSAEPADLNTTGRKITPRKLLRALKNRQVMVKGEGEWNPDDDTDNDSE